MAKKLGMYFLSCYVKVKQKNNMINNISLISSFAGTNNFNEDHLKLCFLWYDKILLETIGEYHRTNYARQILEKENIGNNDLNNFTDIVLPLDGVVSNDLLGEYENSREHDYPRWEKDGYLYYSYPSPVNANEYAHNVLLAHIQHDWKIEKVRGIDVEQMEGRARVAIDAVNLWEYVQQEVDCIMEANNDEKLAMTSAREFNLKEKSSIDPFKIFEMSVPNLSKVPWSEIIKLKINGDIDGLRNKFKESCILAPHELDLAQKQFKTLEKEAFENIIDKFRPSTKKVTIETLLANIPGLPLNPASVFFGVRDIISEKNKTDELSWYYFLRDIKSAAAKGKQSA